MAGAALGAGLAWYAWRGYQVPEPPQIPLAEADPAVAQAVAQARHKVQRDLRSASSWGELGKILRAADILEPAALCFARAASLDSHNPRWPYLLGEALLLPDPASALAPLRQAVTLSQRQGEDLLAPRLRLAEALLAGGLHEEAKVQLEQALKIQADHPSLHLNLGLLALAREDFQTGRRHLLRCQHSPFTRQKACAQLAVVAMRLQDPALAEKFSRLASTLPQDLHWSDPYVMECLQRAPGKPGIFRYVEQLEAQGRYQDAIASLQELVKKSPDCRAFILLGRNLSQLGNLPEAEQALRDALRLAPANAQAHYYLSKVLWFRGEKQREKEPDTARGLFNSAAGHARHALKHRADDALVHMILGLCLKRLGQGQESLACLHQAVEHGPELADPNLHLGEALAEEGRVAQARPFLENALRLARPDDPRPRQALERLRKR